VSQGSQSKEDARKILEMFVHVEGKPKLSQLCPTKKKVLHVSPKIDDQ
jgi:hypothetical protein